jgi:hypothetical protein
MAMEVDFQCPSCSKSNSLELHEIASPITCAFCEAKLEVSGIIDENGHLQKCGICGCRDLYIQKDFNRKVGLAIVAIGAILAPFTKLISLLICALIDLILYRALPFITICYRCGSIYRGFRSNPDHQAFNLGINDRYRSKER